MIASCAMTLRRDGSAEGTWWSALIISQHIPTETLLTCPIYCSNLTIFNHGTITTNTPPLLQPNPPITTTTPTITIIPQLLHPPSPLYPSYYTHHHHYTTTSTITIIPHTLLPHRNTPIVYQNPSPKTFQTPTFSIIRPTVLNLGYYDALMIG